MIQRSLFVCVCVALGLAWPSLANAQMFKDAALDAFYSTGSFVALDQAAAPRLAGPAPDPEAVLARALSTVQGYDAARLAAAIQLADQCVQRDAKATACHYAHGLTLGMQALSEGMLKALGNVGRIRSSFIEAVALDPAWFAARSALMEFYLNAPALAGGSASKAQELISSAPKPEQQRALQARLLVHQHKTEAALKSLHDLRGTRDSALAADLRSWTITAGTQLIKNGQLDAARPLFEKLQQEQPSDAMAPFFLSRVYSDSGQHDAALKLLSAAAKGQGAERLPIDYRVGISHQELGNKEAARLALNKFVNAGRGSKNALSDAKKRLEQLAQS